MKANFLLIISYSIAMLLYGCGDHNTNDSAIKTPQTSSDSTYNGTFDQLSEITRKEFDISEVLRKRDTLSLIVMSKEAYYPFGRLKNTEQLKRISPYLQLKSESYKDSVLDTVTLIRLSFKGSFLKFYNNGETGMFEIVSGKITNEEINVYKTVHLGMSMEDFLRIYFTKNIDKFTKDISVIELVSGIDGVWQHYEFKDNRLKLVTFVTDYTFDKN